MKLAICDDDRYQLEKMETLVKSELEKMHVDCAVDVYRSSCVLNEMVNLESYDIFFLDIRMPKLSGFDVAASIRKVSDRAIIMFLSDDDNLAFQAFEYRPYWYLQKEDFPEKIPYVLRKSIKEYVNSKLYVDIGDEEKRPVRKDAIYFIECDSHKLFFHMKEGTFTKYGTLTKMEEKLGDMGFLRVHKNYMVNLEHVRYLETDTIIMLNGKTIALSKYKREILKVRLLEI